MLRRRSSALLLAWLLATGGALACREARAPSEPIGPPQARALAGGVHWVRSSAEYRALALQSWRAAGARLPRLVEERPAGEWAVALDADETLLDNTPYQLQLAEAGHGHDPELWHAWCRRREARAVPGAAGFLAEVRRLGGKIAVVTNRSEQVCEDTEANLAALGLPFDVVLCRPEGDRGDKQLRWTAIEKGTAAPGLAPLEIVLWAGDNIGDFPGLSQTSRDEPGALDAVGDRFFVLPNPMYGSWESNPRG
jgi:5'-nucleotidase (lipoprotein e(P4) family)